jgi:hypothetical protein
MQIKRILTRLIQTLFLHFIFSVSVYTQEININLKGIDSMITTNSKDLVFDVNGEICSMVFLTTDLEGLKFYSNLGIEKISKTDNGYTIWIPHQANVLKFIIPEFPLFEYKLPDSNYKFSVYIIVLSAQKKEKIILKDTMQPYLSITTTPAKATIILNGVHKGESPMIIKNPDFVRFEYFIKKKGYSSYSLRDSMDKKIKNISIELNDLRRNKRYFLTLNIKEDVAFGSPKEINFPGMYGLTFGIFGKTGMYGSLNVLPMNVVSGSYYNFDDKVQKLSLSSGITQQLGNSVFFYGGPGYIKRYYKRLRNVYQVGSYYLPNYTEENIESLNINTGLIFRIGWYSVLQFDFCKSINSSYFSLGFGLGYNFPKKSKISLKMKPE